MYNVIEEIKKGGEFIMNTNREISRSATVLGIISIIISAVSVGLCVRFFFKYIRLLTTFGHYNIILLLVSLLTFAGVVFKFVGLLIKREYSIVIAVLSFVLVIIHGVLFLAQFFQRAFDPSVLYFQYSLKVYMCGALVNFLFFIYYLTDAIASSRGQKAPGFMAFLPLVCQILFAIIMCNNDHLQTLLTQVRDNEFMLYIPLSFIFPAVAMLFLCPAILIRQKASTKSL